MASSQFFSAQTRFDDRAIHDIIQKYGRHPTSPELFELLLAIINQEIAQGGPTRLIANFARLAIKLAPYSPRVSLLIAIHDSILRQFAVSQMAELLLTLQKCREMQIPMPVIVSCEKYLTKALHLQKAFQDRYFGISPLVVKGNPDLTEESYENGILTVCADDSYEALPVKMAETHVFLRAAQSDLSFLKIDDDMKLTPITSLEIGQIRSLFSSADYMGCSVFGLDHNRLWHVGKCKTPVPAVYSKPIKTPWARGAIYSLSAHAAEKLTTYYMRFPSTLDGEMYEDKATADMLYDNGVLLTPCNIEHFLGIDSTSPERLNEEKNNDPK